MSWTELERLVEAAERDPCLRRALAHCRSTPELLLAAQRLGFEIRQADLVLARRLDRQPVVRDPSRSAAPGGPHHPEGTSRCG